MAPSPHPLPCLFLSRVSSLPARLTDTSPGPRRASAVACLPQPVHGREAFADHSSQTSVSCAATVTYLEEHVPKWCPKGFDSLGERVSLFSGWRQFSAQTRYNFLFPFVSLDPKQSRKKKMSSQPYVGQFYAKIGVSSVVQGHQGVKEVNPKAGQALRHFVMHLPKMQILRQ